MLRVTLSLVLVALIVSSAPLLADSKRISETLTGFEEVPALSTPGGGRFHARIANNGSAVAWELRYANLESAVVMAHIHFENPTNEGPVVVWLCDNTGFGPAGTQPCPPQPATITGTFDAGDVTGDAAAQGIAAGELAELIRAIRAGSTYVNVHSTGRPLGEIRGQLDDHSGHGDDD